MELTFYSRHQKKRVPIKNGKAIVIPGFEEFSFCIGHTNSDTWFSVTELKSGEEAGFGRRRADAIEDATRKLNRFGKANVREMVALGVKRSAGHAAGTVMY